VKKPTLRIEEQHPRNIQRADIAPANGYAKVVDGYFVAFLLVGDAASTKLQELRSDSGFEKETNALQQCSIGTKISQRPLAPYTPRDKNVTSQ
jgi:hypothetical protein